MKDKNSEKHGIINEENGSKIMWQVGASMIFSMFLIMLQFKVIPILIAFPLIVLSFMLLTSHFEVLLSGEEPQGFSFKSYGLFLLNSLPYLIGTAVLLLINLATSEMGATLPKLFVLGFAVYATIAININFLQAIVKGATVRKVIYQFVYILKVIQAMVGLGLSIYFFVTASGDSKLVLALLLPEVIIGLLVFAIQGDDPKWTSSENVDMKASVDTVSDTTTDAIQFKAN